MEYFSKDSINKFKEISSFITNTKKELPDIIKNMFNIFYKNYVIKKNIKIIDPSISEINNYKNNMNYMFKNNKKRYTEFKKSLNSNNLRVLTSIDYPFIKMVYLENNKRVFEVFNLFITYYLTKLELGKNIKFSKDMVSYIYESPYKREIRTEDFNNNKENLFDEYYKDSIGLFVSGLTNYTGFTAGTSEELHKLFWHELLHFSKADTYNEGRTLKIKYSNQKISFEGFTEFMSIIYHILEMVSKLKYTKKYDNDKCYKLISQFINIETHWSLFVVSKLIKLLNYDENFFTNNIIKFNKITLLSYYVGKSILLFNFYSFVNNTYFNDDLTVKKKYYDVENEMLNNITKEYIDKLKICFDNLKYSSNSIGYICIELNDFENINEFINVNNIMKGGVNDFKKKYIKYKNKYITLKNNL